MGRLASAYHAFAFGSRRLSGSPSTGKGGDAFGSGDPIPLTVPEVRRLLCRLLWRRLPSSEHTLAGSRWRRWHQKQAQRSHYKRRMKPT
ncbi:hypothetical protein FJZ36_18880 [Candidatus Poribacteria bacterium]|nr:hypothetical protein [Candidatus Poribacteria bacterium]